MKIVKIILVSIALLLYTNIGAAAAAAGPDSSGKAAILMDGATGRVLYGKNIRQKLPMASTTKIMTAIVALENGRLDDEVVIPPEASGVEGSSIWLAAGEKHTLENLLYALMLRSGNDAATAIAMHISGSVEAFAELMNQTARRIGAYDTNFANPHGLHHKDHYTTAYDLALISSYALKNPDFEAIVSSKYRTIPWEGHTWSRAMKNKNQLLWSYEGANGVKTGYTKKSGRCLVASAKRNGMQLVSAVIDCGDWFRDCAALMDYGFANYSNHEFYRPGDHISTLTVKNGKSNEVRLVVQNGFSIALAEDELSMIRTEAEYPEAADAPITAGQKMGSVKIYFQDHLMDELPIVASDSVEKHGFWDFLRKMVNFWR